MLQPGHIYIVSGFSQLESQRNVLYPFSEKKATIAPETLGLEDEFPFIDQAKEAQNGASGSSQMEPKTNHDVHDMSSSNQTPIQIQGGRSDVQVLCLCTLNMNFGNPCQIN